MYKLFLSLHIISIISWMAGMLYLFRLFVYHAEETAPIVKERLIIMQAKLYKIITLPAMIASYIFGIAMLSLKPELLSQGWLHAKLALVMAMSGLLGFAKQIHLSQALGTYSKSGKILRILNEAPTLLMIIIVFLVIFKPFTS